MHEVLTKSAFASFVGVTRGRVSQWLSERKLSGDALVGTGVRARIRVDVALEQLKQTLDVDQRMSGNARARLDGAEQNILRVEGSSRRARSSPWTGLSSAMTLGKRKMACHPARARSSRAASGSLTI